jgi:hypothetical protein
MNIAIQESTTSRALVTPATPFTDLTLGAPCFGIRGPKVLIESSILEDYAETDPSLGMNAAGMILTVLGQQMALNPGGGRDESIVVGLNRRDDGRNVELDLSLTRSRRQGQEYLHLTRLGDREVE